jgi:hypothetical protein
MDQAHHVATSATEAANKSVELLIHAKVAALAANDVRDVEASTARLIMQSVKSDFNLVLEYALQSAEYAVTSAQATGDQKAIDDANATLTSIHAALAIHKLIS